MKKLVVALLLFVLLYVPSSLSAAESLNIQITPVPCNNTASCPSGLTDIYQKNGEKCAASLEEFQKAPATSHYWVEDPTITSQGKANERARQFIYWTLNTGAIDSAPVITTVWNTTRNIAYFLVIFAAAIMGLGIIIGQRFQFATRIKVWPSLMKLGGALLIVTFSAAVTLLLIQLSEILVKFFIETLKGKDLFNIYFTTNIDGVPITQSNEANYVNFVGCRDLNIRVQESSTTELLMFKLTNFTYYAMGAMIILRKIILWFLIIVSPFLSILLPFTFIRNVGLIWIGVFFQWLFYGPLFAIFVGALSTMWKAGIPFAFDFSRTGTTKGYVYPTATNIVYGGPAQTLGALNSANYIDTFAEYVITLIMLWTAIVLPWLLLRIFRDYCCNGINASKNILLSMYDQMRSGGRPPNPPSISPVVPTVTSTSLKIPHDVEVPVRVSLQTIEEIKKAQTREILQSVHISANSLADIAQYETDKQMNQSVKYSMDKLQNPLSAQTTAERQRYMNIRTELFNRAVKDDALAKRALAGISQLAEKKAELAKVVPQKISVEHAVSVQLNIPLDKISAIQSSVKDVFAQKDFLDKVAHATLLPAPTVQKILSSIWNANESIVQEQPIDKDKILLVATHTKKLLEEDKELLHKIAEAQQLTDDQVKQIFSLETGLKVEPEKHVEKTISIPPTVAIEDYENVKKMWQKHYEKSDIPVSENIKTRKEWVNHDIVFITNTLNKLTSQEDTMREAGIGDVGYILPVFMINNFTSEELLVYLRAKLEAAKSIEEQLDKETQIKEELSQNKDEVLIDIQKPKTAEKEKTMEAKKELTQK